MMRGFVVGRTTSLLALTIGSGAFCFYLGRSPMLRAQSGGVKSFYLEQTVAGVSPEDGVFRPFKELILARRSDGTTVQVESIGPPVEGLRIRKVLSTDGRAVSLIDKYGLKTSWPVLADPDAASLVRRLTDPPASCVSGSGADTVVRHDVAQGQDIEVVQEVLDNKGVLTMWKMPQFACEELYYSNEKAQADGSISLDLEKTTVKFVAGEPSQDLFTVNANYVESSPSVALSRLVHATSIQMTPELERDLRIEGQEMDRRYKSRGGVKSR
jgi:hypothetical protein